MTRYLKHYTAEARIFLLFFFLHMIKVDSIVRIVIFNLLYLLPVCFSLCGVFSFVNVAFSHFRGSSPRDIFNNSNLRAYKLRIV